MDQRHTWGINTQLPNAIADNPRTLSSSSSRISKTPISTTKETTLPNQLTIQPHHRSLFLTSSMRHRRHTHLARPRPTLEHLETFPPLSHLALTRLPAPPLLYPHEPSSSLSNQMPPRHRPATSKRIYQFSARGLRRQDVDDCVQKPLHRQD